MIQADSSAPRYAHDLAKSAQREVDARSYPYVSKTPVTVAQLASFPASKYAWLKMFLSDGVSGPEATSTGAAWVYPDGSAV